MLVLVVMVWIMDLPEGASEKAVEVMVEEGHVKVLGRTPEEVLEKVAVKDFGILVEKAIEAIEAVVEEPCEKVLEVAD